MTDTVVSPREPSGTRVRHRPGRASLRVAINLLTDDPRAPSGSHWFWTRVLPELSAQAAPGEDFALLVSPASRPLHRDYGRNVRYITFPWSNEHRGLRTLSEHVYAPVRLPLGNVDVFNTLLAPVAAPGLSLVLHFKTMHAFTAPDALGRAALAYRRWSYPRSARKADVIIINSNSLRADVERYLDVDPAKLRLIYEAVDHDVFRPGDRNEARASLRRYGVLRPFVLFVSSLWRYKNCDGLIRAWSAARSEMGGRQLVVVGPARDEQYAAELRSLVADLGLGADVVFVGGVPLEDTAAFYRAADVFVYPSHEETFGLPILEAMACGCPVVTSDRSAMPEIAGGAAVLADPADPRSIAAAVVVAAGSDGAGLRRQGLRRAGEFTWRATAGRTLDVYREAAEMRRRR